MFIIFQECYSQYMLIPMDHTQRNHLKAYGIAYKAIQSGGKVEWLLNYKGGSFICPAIPTLQKLAKLGNTYYEDPHNSIRKFDFVMANTPFNVPQSISAIITSWATSTSRLVR